MNVMTDQNLPKLVDIKGTPIQRGSIIFYAVRRSSSLNLRQAIVEQIVEHTVRYPGHRPGKIVKARRIDNGHRVRIERVHRLIVVHPEHYTDRMWQAVRELAQNLPSDYVSNIVAISPRPHTFLDAPAE